MADNAMTYRLVVKEVAMAERRLRDLHAEAAARTRTAPACTSTCRSSAASATPSSTRTTRYHLSAVARGYIAGLLRHAREITLVTNQWVNSYKRLVPGFEAPVYLSWARRNRSDLIRVPEYKPRQGERDAHRVPRAGPGLQPVPRLRRHARRRPRGHREGVPAAAEPRGERLRDDRAERKERGIDHLPGSLYEAIEDAESSDLLRRCLGDHVFESLLTTRRSSGTASAATSRTTS